MTSTLLTTSFSVFFWQLEVQLKVLRGGECVHCCCWWNVPCLEGSSGVALPPWLRPTGTMAWRSWLIYEHQIPFYKARVIILLSWSRLFELWVLSADTFPWYVTGDHSVQWGCFLGSARLLLKNSNCRSWIVIIIMKMEHDFCCMTAEGKAER